MKLTSLALNDSGPYMGLVKWYDSIRGFGFLVFSDSKTSKDVFLHASVLRRSPLDTVQPGDRLICHIGNGRKGPVVEDVLKKIPEDDTGRYREMGTVRFYDMKKGYGFIETADGKDVYISAATLKQLGIAPLQRNQLVKLSFIETDKGFVAETLSFLM